jgi:hypothetical protein
MKEEEAQRVAKCTRMQKLKKKNMEKVFIRQ